MLTPVVMAQPDGVHIQVVERGEATAVELRPYGFPYIAFGSGSDGLDGIFVRPLPVGQAIVSCDGGPVAATPRAWEATFEVVDPQGIFVDWLPACPFTEIVAFDARVQPGEPVEVVDEGLRGALDPGDEVELAGYRRAASRTWRDVRIVRRSLVVAWAVVTRSGMISVAACERANLHRAFDWYRPADDLPGRGSVGGDGPDSLLAEGTAGRGVWTLTTYGEPGSDGVELRWTGDDGRALRERVRWDGTLSVGVVEASDVGDPDDEIVFGVVPRAAVQVVQVPGQGLPESTVAPIPLPDAPFAAFVITTYAGIGVVWAGDKDPDDGHGSWRALIVPDGARQLHETVESFLRARIAREGAERFLVPGEASRYAIQNPVPSGWARLYQDANGRGFNHAVVLFIDALSQGGESSTLREAEVGVLIEGPSGMSRETLSVVRQADGNYLIALSRLGTSGP